MILVTGGLGFIGSHTVRDPRVVVERADVTELRALLDVGDRHKITGIVHLAGSMPRPPGAGEPVEATRTAIGGLLNVVRAAREWDVRRLGIASTIGVYGGVAAEGALGEDLPLPMTSGHVIPRSRRSASSSPTTWPAPPASRS
jgi:UDP-glucose 4-epimerase